MKEFIRWIMHSEQLIWLNHIPKMFTGYPVSCLGCTRQKTIFKLIHKILKSIAREGCMWQSVRPWSTKRRKLQLLQPRCRSSLSARTRNLSWLELEWTSGVEANSVMEHWLWKLKSSPCGVGNIKDTSIHMNRGVLEMYFRIEKDNWKHQPKHLIFPYCCSCFFCDQNFKIISPLWFVYSSEYSF